MGLPCSIEKLHRGTLKLPVLRLTIPGCTYKRIPKNIRITSILVVISQKTLANHRVELRPM